jgi:outer membrane protein assembly factor BamB
MNRGLGLVCLFGLACGGTSNAGSDGPATLVQLAVSVAGTGLVTGSQGISCPSQCNAVLPRGTQVTLTAAQGVFARWQGCSSSTTTCTLTLDAATSVTAVFTSAPPAGPAAAAVTVTPTTVSLQVEASQQFTAKVTNAANTAVDWSIAEGAAGGTVTAAGFYQAPRVSGAYHVVATSRADPAKSATAAVTVLPVTVEIIPPSAGLTVGDVLQLAAKVGNSPDATVDWSVVEGGTVNAGGLFQSPETPGTFHVVARSRIDPAKSFTAVFTTREFVPQAVAYQIGVDHAGQIAFAAPLVFPAAPLWSVTLPLNASYPVIAGGKVFVNIVGATDTTGGSRLYALDAATGDVAWGPVSIPGNTNFAGSAYDDGKIYVMNGSSMLLQFDAETGAPGFKINLGFLGDVPPVASKGIVYVGDGSSLSVFAVLEATGEILWESHVEAGFTSSPALSEDTVFVAYPGDYYALSRATGDLRWITGQGSEGGGGWTTVYHAGRVYIRDTDNLRTGIIVDATTGHQLGTFPSQFIPAVTDTTAFLLDQGNLEALDLASGTVEWSFAGDGALTAAPIVINGAVIAGSGNGAVYALDAATGTVLWTASVPAAIGSPISGIGLGQPTPGLAAGEGILVIPAGNTLTAWRLQ